MFRHRFGQTQLGLGLLFCDDVVLSWTFDWWFATSVVVATGWFKNLYCFMWQDCQDVGLSIKPVCSSCTGICWHV